MSAVAERLTADEYLSREDPRRTELIDGIVLVNEPTRLHQYVCGEVFGALRDWVRGGGHGDVTFPLDVPLDARNVLAPDVLWFAEPLPIDAPRALRPPDLAVEVRSASTWAYDISRKRELYERHGVRELWLADTASGTMIMCARSRKDSGFDVVQELGAGKHLTSELLPGFRVAVADIFPQP
jgi:Uma2 family endonuclease